MNRLWQEKRDKTVLPPALGEMGHMSPAVTTLVREERYSCVTSSLLHSTTWARQLQHLQGKKEKIKLLYLQLGVGIELVKEIHDSLLLEGMEAFGHMCPAVTTLTHEQRQSCITSSLGWA